MGWLIELRFIPTCLRPCMIGYLYFLTLSCILKGKRILNSTRFSVSLCSFLPLAPSAQFFGPEREYSEEWAVWPNCKRTPLMDRRWRSLYETRSGTSRVQLVPLSTHWLMVYWVITQSQIVIAGSSQTEAAPALVTRRVYRVAPKSNQPPNYHWIVQRGKIFAMKFDSERRTGKLWVGIKYSVRYLIHDVIRCCAWSVGVDATGVMIEP